MRRLLNKDTFAALFVLLFGLGTILGSGQYETGSLARMGPGYFPKLLGFFLLFLGLILFFSPNKTAESLGVAGWLHRLRPWFFILIGLVSFVVLGLYFGFIPATFALIFLAGFADKNNTFKSLLILALLVTLFAVLVFHYGIGLQFPLIVWG